MSATCLRRGLQVWKWERWSARKIPSYYLGEQFEPTALHLHEGHTSPPSPLSEARAPSKAERGFGRLVSRLTGRAPHGGRRSSLA